ncbi:hypothetical protein HNQ38_001135 [Desulfovibrio intestinalis]|uniref:Uncharacterized protein n=1 Tax=Desulfovibrio intestinalis TaxID=58621 RepID=A0A7W8BZX1_9BACT|nr:hypothetical protein [Desulfovibrio intestinalis]
MTRPANLPHHLSHCPTLWGRDSGTVINRITPQALAGLKQAMFSLRSNGLLCEASKHIAASRQKERAYAC